MVAKKSKTVDRQKIITKFVRRLKKEFGGLPKKDALPVLETVIYSICLEDSPIEAAQEAFDRLQDSFFDWNEVRVSTISELEPIFDGLANPEYRAMRSRYMLYYVFDHQYSYDFDAIRRKPLNLVQKQLSKIKHLTPFVRNYLLQNSLGTHIIPLDSQMLKVVLWLGLVPRGATEDTGGDLLKTYVRKADGFEFAWLLKNLAISSKAKVVLELEESSPEMGTPTIEDIEDRLEDLLSGRLRRRVSQQKAAAKKKAEAKKKDAARKKAAAAKKKAKKAAKPKAAKKTAAKKKPSARKPAAKKAAKKKTAKKTARRK